MEINKIALNGVEYALSDAQAQQIAAVLTQRVDNLEDESARLDQKIDTRLQIIEVGLDDMARQQQEIREDLKKTVVWGDLH